MNDDGSRKDYQEQIREIAYDYWVGRGRPLGSPEVDWLAAEKHFAENPAPPRTPFSLYGLALEPTES